MEPKEPQVPGAEPEPIPGWQGEFPARPREDQAWKRVYFGQVADPLVPPHPEPAESAEDELAQAALQDPGAATRDMPDSRPTFWRVIVLILVAVAALAVVFWRK